MNKHARRVQALARAHKKTTAEVAALLHVSVPTVNSWYRPASNLASRVCQQWAPELLEYKLTGKLDETPQEPFYIKDEKTGKWTWIDPESAGPK